MAKDIPYPKGLDPQLERLKTGIKAICLSRPTVKTAFCRLQDALQTLTKRPLSGDEVLEFYCLSVILHPINREFCNNMDKNELQSLLDKFTKTFSQTLPKPHNDTDSPLPGGPCSEEDPTN